jgi:lysophospholipase L1-like esterase
MHHQHLRLLWSTATLLALATTLTILEAASASATYRQTASQHALSSPTASATAATAPTQPAASPSPTTSAPSPTPSAVPYRVVGLGDSVPAGTMCGCTSYIDQVGQEAARQNGDIAAVENLAQSGLTTAGLAAQLRQSAVAAQIADADLIIVTIGANDFDQSLLTASACQPATTLACYQTALMTQRSLLSAILDQITNLHTQHPGRVLITGYWNVFLDGQVAQSRGTSYTQASNALTLAENALIASASAGHADTYVDIYTPFKGNGTKDDTALLAADGDHPNAAGHALIAQTLMQELT